jgi:hypothetical protein
MAKQTINIGSAANDGTGDTLRAAFDKTNHNFTEVYGTAQAAFNAANSFNSIDGAFAQDAYTKANGAYGEANSATSLAQAAFDQANTGTGSTGDIRFDGTWIHNKDTGNIYISPQDGQTWLNLPADTEASVGWPVTLASVSANGQVAILTGTTGNSWNFGSDGKLTLPNGTKLENYNQGTALYSTTGPAVLYSHVGGGIESVELRAKGDGGDSSVILKSDGTLTVPGVITGTETAPSWSHNITSITLGTDTIITFDQSEFYGPVIGQVTIQGLDSTVEANGTWYYQAWNNNALKLFTDNTVTTGIDSTTWTPYTSGGTITNLNYGGVSIQANENVWDFKADGSLKVPGDIIVGSSPNPSGKEQHFIIDADNYWTSIQWKNFSSPQDPNNTPFECQAQLLRVFSNDNTVTAWCNVNNPREELVALTAIRPDNTNYNGLMFSTSDTKIPDAPYNDGTGTRHDWILHGDGTTQLPNMPTNARTGNADALIFTKLNGRTGQKVIGTQSGTVDNPVVERLVIAGGDGYGSGEGGDIYLWAGRSSVDANGGGAGGGDIKVDAGDAYDIDGGTIKIRGGNSNVGSNNLAHPGGWIEIDAGSSWNGGNGADINLNAGGAYNGGTDGKVRVTTGKGTYAWDFQSDGIFKFAKGDNNINKQSYGMGDLVAYRDGEWVLGEYNGSNYGTIGMRIAPGIEGSNELILPSNSNSANNPVQLNNYENGGVTIRSGSNTWTFGATGTTTLPNNNLETFVDFGIKVQTGIPSGPVNKITANQGWGDGQTGPNLSTTGGSGTGLTVDVYDGGSAYASISINTPGTGYKDGEIITVTSADESISDNFIISVPSNTWTFGSDSSLTVPSEIKSAANTGSVTIKSDDGFNTHTWTFGETGNLTLPGVIVGGTATITGSEDPAYPTALDLTKRVNKLSNNPGSNYTLADGVEGQIMYLVPQDGATIGAIYIIMSNTRILNDATTTSTVFQNVAYYPFSGSTTANINNMATLIFTDGAWNVNNGSFDY